MPPGRESPPHFSAASRAEILLLRLPVVGDNAAMSKPFQFSMRVMFAGMAWFCVGAWELSVVAKRRPVYLAAYVSCFALITLLGAALGAPAGKAKITALCGLAMSMALIAILILLTPSQIWP